MLDSDTSVICGFLLLNGERLIVVWDFETQTYHCVNRCGRIILQLSVNIDEESVPMSVQAMRVYLSLIQGKGMYIGAVLFSTGILYIYSDSVGVFIEDDTVQLTIVPIRIGT